MLLAEAITELYHKVEANPEDYPRGMTVRVLLGNPPRIDLNSDLWRILGNLRAAGLPDMENPDIGWKLEVANFEGSFPHSHIKILIIDGITAVSTGFNYQYHHYPEDHPSGRGEGTVDIGIQVTGPAAQEVQTAFDDLWDGATQRHCESLDKSNITWQFTCRDSKAVPNHVPEVKRYYLSGGDAVVFSMLRSEVLLLSDNMVQASIAHAQDSLDVVQAMFAMPPVCMLNFMFDLCTFDQAMPYIDGIMQAAENGAEVRLLLKMTPVLGTEALVALQIMADELEVRGLEDQIEIRAFPIALHAKTFLIDDELVIIGSQNFHYTAFGEGLAEHNLGVLDPEAAADYKRVFDYYWDIAGEEIVTE
jgi:phosphatidylserine/phosphatidylglycerophosphate/cardiolipin synthase-like enzyme